MLKIKRVYEAPEPTDGIRILVDRMWPRGVSRTSAELFEWARNIAPSKELCDWFHHDRERWEEFRARYHSELEFHKEELDRLRRMADDGVITLLYGSRDTVHNNAVALLEFLTG